ncbi:SAM-dependent methyltransferase [Antrihabitans cavernicola]|uniref:Class I SAM-dependent methyltransferase n=1 Tax=Antrihabitans cavernicola TaxID=2495913 RepID=A0A5A7SDK9_9NOCA|nr:cyclopropane-fatty-acyl-phospholipid synthase family protein [Spelaeibacter cavernicola]KAA0022827.1 class I SAM-dependent methyltransferase [Spelaeibacter cavernicola]
MSTAQRILTTFEQIAGGPVPVGVRSWDGSTAGPSDPDVTVVFRNRRALRRVLWSPNEIGLARAYVSGDMDVEGDLFALIEGPAVIERIARRDLRELDRHEIRDIANNFLRLGALGLPPKPPAEEVRRRAGAKHSKDRDAEAVSHHYDVGNDFYRLILGPSMVYSCAYWATPGSGTLEDAQFAKMDLICRKLGLTKGMRLLDVGCGWGSMAIHAATHYGVDVVGVTISHEQRELALKRVAEAGMSDRIEIRLQDYRDVADGPYDAISSIGMSEHVGDAQLTNYACILFGLLRPGGRLLNHAIASVAPIAPQAKSPQTFVDRYIFPDGELLPLSHTVGALERAGFETRDSEALREHYALTLRSWVDDLRGSWDEAVELVGAARARTWLLYLAASALSFERGRITIHQVLAVRRHESGAAEMPRTRAGW